MELQALLQPIAIGRLTARNRVVMPPMVLNAARQGGYVSEKQLRHYEERAEGVGLVIVESTNIMPGGEIASNQLQICDDRYIDGLKTLATAIASKNAIALIQINHGGAKAFPLTRDKPFSRPPMYPFLMGRYPEA